jgi:hypothetical protein
MDISALERAVPIATMKPIAKTLFRRLTLMERLLLRWQRQWNAFDARTPFVGPPGRVRPASAVIRRSECSTVA